MLELHVKKWFYEKTASAAASYNVYIDFARQEDGTIAVTDDTVTLYAREVLAESEKAIKVCLESGAVVGSCKGWTVWLPKSLVTYAR